ncbi:hypothetical protein AWB75_02285 [Caballeronia catudaia]|uniref:Uncharacterized protein n=1 Tax=Caballeronia catudaia TaxID=1777136 RepID=A0A158AK18_9BURK|nr:hypothetical protein AWB75_02285 [Caballeronia catudaia]
MRYAEDCVRSREQINGLGTLFDLSSSVIKGSREINDAFLHIALYIGTWTDSNYKTLLMVCVFMSLYDRSPFLFNAAADVK